MHDPRPTTPQDPVETLRSLVRLWSASADQAFATGLTDPAAYARTIRLVTATVDALRARGDSAEELLAAWSDRGDLLAAVAEADELLTLEGLNHDAVAGAAFAMRHREVADAITRTRRLATLAASRPEDDWVVVEEAGPFDGDPYVPYRRLEIDQTEGRAILVSTHPDETFSAPVHVVELLQFDPTTGNLGPADDDATATEPQEFSRAEDRERHVAQLRGATTPPGPG